MNLKPHVSSLEPSEVEEEKFEAAPGYLPIGDYALIGDCHSAALISRGGSIDWCCLPRFDSDSCFARILDRDRGGHFLIAPEQPAQSRRRYAPGSMVLETTFESEQGEVRLTDFFAMRAGGARFPRRELVRVIEGVRGSMRIKVEIAPRLDFGDVKPWIYGVGNDDFVAAGSDTGLLFSGDAPLELVDRHNLRAHVTLRAGERRYVSMQFISPAELQDASAKLPKRGELKEHLEETLAWWREWGAKILKHERPGACPGRSAIVLKALTYAPTGAIIAAPTTSLPEHEGGERNWDYRFSWIRDSVFTARALSMLGLASEADGFRRFIMRSAAGSAEQLQVLYGIDGKRRLTEIEIDHLEGWRGSKPVRIGNGAESQFQADMYGLLLELAWRFSARGNPLDDEYWGFLVSLVEAAIEKWPQPDSGIWEVRGDPQHFVHSKVMCWAAVNRGIELAEKHSLVAPLAEWRRARDEIRTAIEQKGIDPLGDYFVAAFESTHMDAALLLLPEVDFIAYDDPRMIRTVDAVRRELDVNGLVLRYCGTDDGLAGQEGVFLPCTFWLAECLARAGRVKEARAVFDRVCGCANELGLFPEEFDTHKGEMLGNFPQGLTHLAHIAAALSIDAVERGHKAPELTPEQVEAPNKARGSIGPR
ncbi:MAG: glycoside hydrolase family 15 protein [Burkholderiales bacterium]